MASYKFAHSKSVEDILGDYKISEEDGLSNDRVLEQRKKFGFNGEVWYVFCGIGISRCM